MTTTTIDDTDIIDDETETAAPSTITPATPELAELASVYGLTASYSPEDNKLRMRIEREMPKEKYQGVLKPYLKAYGFIWAPKQRLLVAPRWTPGRHDFLLGLCGEIGDEETSLAERSEQRADRFIGYKVNRTEDGNRAYDRASSIMQGIPDGQPIIVGHHSQERAERDAKRIEGSLRKACIMWERADYWHERAAGVISHADYKDRPDVRARRIEEIGADKRRQERAKAKAEKELKAWNYEGMTDALACALADRIWLHVHTDERGISYRASDVLRPADERPEWSQAPVWTWQEVRDVARRVYPPRIEYAQRWINHCELRIAYEKAILAAQGASHLLQKKPRPKPLPLLNYRAPEGLTVRSPYDRQAVKYPQVAMTMAEFMRIYSEKRGTRVVIDGSHRVRFALLGGYWGNDRRDAVIFITDNKEHKRPETPVAPAAEDSVDDENSTDETVAPIAEPKPEREPSPVAALLDRSDYSARLEAVRDTLRAGIQAVSADQLFPTPRDVVERLMRAANIRLGDRVLEPSAGTGALVRAMLDSGAQIRAVEISAPIAEQLRARYSGVEVICADFMECGPDTIGEVDVIVANPPFANGQDVEHVDHMLDFRPRRIVAVMLNDGQSFRPELEDEPPASGRRADRVAELRARVESEGRTMSVDEFPEGSFASQGTGVRTVLVTIE